MLPSFFFFFLIRENFAQLDIFYRRMSYEEITQQKAFDTFALFCKYTST